MKRSENMTKILKCGLCDHSVKDSKKSDLIEHFKSAHKIVNEPEKQNPTASAVTQDDHVYEDSTQEDSVDNNIKEVQKRSIFTCAKCEMEFTQKQHLNNHLIRHMNNFHSAVKLLSKDCAENEHQTETNPSPIAIDID